MKIGVKNNIIKDQYSGIILTKETAKTVIELNQFENNDISVEPIHSKFNVITKNNFLGSDPFFRSGINEWNENYWGQPLDKPKKIEGRIFGLIPWYNYDEHPAQEPYIIGGE